MAKELWGKAPDGGDVFRYKLTNGTDAYVVVTNFGATILEVHVPDKEGDLKDVVLGHEKLEDYFNNPGSLGALVGPYANRIGGAAFTIGGKTYHTEANENGNTLHSGSNPLHHRRWETVAEDDSSVTFHIVKPDMDLGFPGNVDLKVTYAFSTGNCLSIHYEATTDKTTALNLTNHAYWNLAGHDSGSCLDEEAVILADFYTEADEESIPHGQITPVEGTPMDFRKGKAIGQDINKTDYRAIRLAHGFDNNFVLNTRRGEISLVGSLTDPKSGRKMEIYTDMPGIQFYSGNFLNPDGPVGKGGVHYHPHDGAAFETQFFPNAINVPFFPQPVLGAGEKFDSTTAYRFTLA